LHLSLLYITVGRDANVLARAIFTSNSFWSKTWKMCGNAVPTRSRPTTPQYTAYVLLKLKEALIGTYKISSWPCTFVAWNWKISERQW